MVSFMLYVHNHRTNQLALIRATHRAWPHHPLHLVRNVAGIRISGSFPPCLGCLASTGLSPQRSSSHSTPWGTVYGNETWPTGHPASKLLGVGYQPRYFAHELSTHTKLHRSESSFSSSWSPVEQESTPTPKSTRSVCTLNPSAAGILPFQARLSDLALRVPTMPGSPCQPSTLLHILSHMSLPLPELP